MGITPQLVRHSQVSTDFRPITNHVVYHCTKEYPQGFPGVFLARQRYFLVQQEFFWGTCTGHACRAPSREVGVLTKRALASQGRPPVREKRRIKSNSETWCSDTAWASGPARFVFFLLETSSLGSQVPNCQTVAGGSRTACAGLGEPRCYTELADRVTRRAGLAEPEPRRVARRLPSVRGDLEALRTRLGLDGRQVVGRFGRKSEDGTRVGGLSVQAHMKNHMSREEN